MYVCLKDWDQVKAGTVLLEEEMQPLNNKLSAIDKEIFFESVSSIDFYVNYTRSRTLKLFRKKIYTSVTYESYRFSLFPLSKETVKIFYEYIGFYILKIKRIDQKLLSEFAFTIIDTLKNLEVMMNEGFEENELRQIIIETGEVYKKLYESVMSLEDDGTHKYRILEAYRRNLEIKQKLLIELKDIK